MKKLIELVRRDIEEIDRSEFIDGIWLAMSILCGMGAVWIVAYLNGGSFIF